jgi:prevent-host-death family protein
MGFDLKVSLDNIIPLTYARDHFSTIVNEVQSDKMYILTKGGKPAIALIDVRYLEQLTGGQIQKSQIKEEINKNPEQVGLPKMVGHDSAPPFSSLKFKPTPPPPLSSTNPPASKPTPPITPPKPVEPKPTPPPPPPAPKPEPKPVEPPPAPKEPGSLILPDDETKKPDSADNDNAKIEVEFSTDAADLETSATHSDNSDAKKSTDEVEDMEIG